MGGPTKTKRCPKCGKTKTLRARTFTFNTVNGKRQWKHCRSCERKRQKRVRDEVKADPKRYAHYLETHKKSQQARRARDPEPFRKGQREWRARIKAEDPQRYAEIFLIPRRFANEGRERLQTATPTAEPFRPLNKFDTVDVGPLRQYLVQRFHGWDAEEVRALLTISVSDRALYRVLYEKDRVSIDIVDRLVTHSLGRPDLLEALYPTEAP
jgi:hypothetical protein